MAGIRGQGSSLEGLEVDLSAYDEIAYSIPG